VVGLAEHSVTSEPDPEGAQKAILPVYLCSVLLFAERSLYSASPQGTNWFPKAPVYCLPQKRGRFKEHLRKCVFENTLRKALSATMWSAAGEMANMPNF
jgi:hypothetical protein